ncbi:MAG: hypothetical protein K5770_12630 [Lachnospiraceae bacterium]|nr:hypothetical protein [Lachnospiraceae bacterium]
MHLIKFNSVSCIFSLIILSASVNIYTCHSKTGFRWTKNEFSRFLFGFAIFSVIFAVAFYVKGFKGSIDCQTEQFMDYGFMQSAYRQQELAPFDMWFSGERLNYYYLGQAASVYLCRLSFTAPEYGYNFMLCTIFAGLLMMVFSLVESVVSYYNNNVKTIFAGSEEKHGISAVCGAVGGLTAALLTACCANGHYLVYGLLIPFIERLTGREIVQDFWFPDSTVFIGRLTGSLDKGKHEFPSYTVILGDLHAHVCNMMFTLPLLALLFEYAAEAFGMDEGSSDEDTAVYMESTHGYLQNKGVTDLDKVLKEVGKGSYKAKLEREKREVTRQDLTGGAYNAVYLKKYDLRELFSGTVLLLSLLLGLFKGVNYWDFPIYFVISGAVILLCDYKKYGAGAKTVFFVLLKGAVILAISFFVMLPFTLSFEKISSEIGLCERHTQIWELMLIWGPRIAAAMALFAFIISRYRRTRHLNTMELTFAALVLCALGLIVLPELIYVKDIYGDDYQRYNTMFKLTYQAYILLGIIIGTAVGIFLREGRILRAAAVTAILFCLLSSSYIGVSVKQWFGDISDSGLRQGISAMDFIRRGDNEYGPEWGAIEYLNGVDKRHINILEAAGRSYNPDCKLSVFTGTCTVIGWDVHEWLWRKDWEIVWKRSDEVRWFYEGEDMEYCRDFLERYNIEYVYVGPRENYYYSVLWEGFEALGDVVSAGEEYVLYRVNPGEY